jgi:chaperone required for assembly of F1-ATPase
LDGRAVKTPASAALVLPTQALAEAIAVEWDAQSGEVRPDTMPLTRYANSAIDNVAVQFDAVCAIVSAYGGTDLICYRAPGPDALTRRQTPAWDSLCDWAAAELSAPLVVTIGVVPVDQPADSLARLAAHVASHSPFELAALHDLVAISGSLVIGLAVLQGHLDADQAFAISRIDEHYQAEVWGQDDEAAALEARKAAEMSVATRFLQLVKK